MRLGRIGFDNVAGYLDGGMQALDGRARSRRPDRADRPRRTLAEQLASTSPPLVLDVRTPREVEAGRIEGSLNVPLNHLEDRLAEIPRDRADRRHCGSGYRSSMAVSILEAHGVHGLSDLVGGMAAWEASRLETSGVG